MSSKRHSQKTQLYDYNYGIGALYQPMIDYLDSKELGVKTPYPHLPFTEERGLERYDPKTIPKSYSANRLDELTRRVEELAKDQLRFSRTNCKTGFQLAKSVSASTLHEQFQKEERTKSRKKKEILRQIHKLKSTMADDLEAYNPKANKDVEIVLKANQKYLRGRSAKGIEAFLAKESQRNIAQGVEFDIEQTQKLSQSHSFAHHLKVVQERVQETFSDDFTKPLEELSHELKGFDQRTAMYYYDKRFLLHN